MKILHVTPLYAPAWRYGGVVRSVSSLAENCAAMGADVAVVTTGIGTCHEGRNELQTEIRNGVQVTYCPAKRTPVGILSRELTQVVAAALPATDLCHITGVWQPSVLATGRLCREKRVPYVTSPRGALSPYSFRDGRLKKCVYYALCEHAIQRNASALHATSPLEERELKALLPRAQVHVIPNICDPSRWFPDRARAVEWRRAHGIEPETLLFLHVGRVEPKKNLPFLGQVARRMPQESDWRFLLVGPAEETELARVTASFRTIPDRLMVLPGTGSEDELRAIYSAATCLLMPSFHENFGNVVLEALFCGTPVVASDHVAAADMISSPPRVTTLPLRPEGWITTLAHQLRAREATEHASDIEDIRLRFSGPQIAARMMRLYETTASTRA